MEEVYKLNGELHYEEKMDSEVISLCDAMNSLPSIETTESCCGHGTEQFRIWFRVMEAKEGLFFLTRCVDRRYWDHGHHWEIELSVGDVFENGHLPIYYLLHSGDLMGKVAYQQADSLVENMNYHLNHKNFMSGYGLNIDEFTADRE